jgi:hypothetical protein
MPDIESRREWSGHASRSGAYTRTIRLRDMAAALRLLDSDPGLWPSLESSLLIRGRPVTMEEVIHFSPRKGNRDPLHWFHSATADRDSEGSHVRLLRDGDQSPTKLATCVERRCKRFTVQPSITPTYLLTNHPLTLDEQPVATLQDFCSA